LVRSLEEGKGHSVVTRAYTYTRPFSLSLSKEFLSLDFVFFFFESANHIIKASSIVVFYLYFNFSPSLTWTTTTSSLTFVTGSLIFLLFILFILNAFSLLFTPQSLLFKVSIQFLFACIHAFFFCFFL
jgi:hypothetical protein